MRVTQNNLSPSRTISPRFLRAKFLKVNHPQIYAVYEIDEESLLAQRQQDLQAGD